jgi:hypothetical protein
LELVETAVESQDIHLRLARKSELYWLDCLIDMLKRCFHLLDCGRGLSMNQVQNG